MGIVIPTSLGEGDGDGPAAAKGQQGGAEGDQSKASGPNAAGTRPVDPSKVGGPPDPEPLRLAKQWEYELEWHAGELRVLSVRALDYRQPMVTPRRIGRYALELWIGAELVERVRFDFPLLAADDVGVGASGSAVQLAPSAHVVQRVLVPAAPRARRARILDRATSKVLTLEWPPRASAPYESAESRGSGGAALDGAGKGGAATSGAGGS